MSRTHQHEPHHQHHHKASGNILVAFLLNLSFAIAELIGGLVTHSVAILSDSVHDLGDALVIGASWWLERRSMTEADERHTYGYRRYSVLAAIITAAVLLIGSGAVVANAIPRILSPQPVDDTGMLAFAILGILLNGLATWKTHGGKSMNQRAVSLHMLEDVLGWVAVLAGAVAIKATGWHVIDPLLSVAIATFVAWNALRMLIDIMPIFLEASPLTMSPTEVEHELTGSSAGIVGIHHLHVWSLDETTTLATMHVVWNPASTTEDVAKAQVRSALRNLGVAHATLELERVGSECGGPCPL